VDTAKQSGFNDIAGKKWCKEGIDVCKSNYKSYFWT
jgi:hypothetical protein